MKVNPSTLNVHDSDSDRIEIVLKSSEKETTYEEENTQDLLLWMSGDEVEIQKKELIPYSNTRKDTISDTQSDTSGDTESLLDKAQSDDEENISGTITFENDRQETAERANAAKRRRDPYIIDWTKVAESVYPIKAIHITDAPPKPKSVKEAIEAFGPYFLAAVRSEMESILEMHKVFKLIKISEVPKGRRILPCKWVYDYKVDSEGNILRFKARLVARGDRQVPDLDFTDTHSPVVKNKAVKVLMAVGTQLGYHFETADIDTAYLYGDLHEQIYMRMPTGFETHQDGEETVAKVVHSLYGLKQAGRMWNIHFSKALKTFGFKQCIIEPCAYYMMDPKMKDLIVALIYVDDIIIASQNKTSIHWVKTQLKTKFSIRDNPTDQWILRTQIEHLQKGTWIGLPNMTITILKDCHRWDTDPKQWKQIPASPSWEHNPLSTELSEDVQAWYTSTIMRLQYLAQSTRPDILFTVNTLAQFQRGPPRECD